MKDTKTNFFCGVKDCDDSPQFTIKRGRTTMVRLCHQHLREYVILGSLLKKVRVDFTELLK